MDSIRYFLGANTADGFTSLYDGFADTASGDFLWILKGGAGCGKSSFMKKIGAADEKNGFACEYAHCSGDPDSLDGVYIPELAEAFVDGTSPHVADANLTGADGAYIDLGRHYDVNSLYPLAEDLQKLKNENTSLYKSAYEYLKAAGSVERSLRSNISPEETENAKKRVTGLLRRECLDKKGDGSDVQRRFLSAYTCKGLFSFPETVSALCARVYVLDVAPELVSDALSYSAGYAVGTGFGVTACPDPLTPERLEAVLIPSAGIALVRGKRLAAGAETIRHVNLEAGTDAKTLRSRRQAEKRLRKYSSALTGEAVELLAAAKAVHDGIESVYNPYVDFDGVYSDVETYIKKLGLMA